MSPHCVGSQVSHSCYPSVSQEIGCVPNEMALGEVRPLCDDGVADVSPQKLIHLGEKVWSSGKVPALGKQGSHGHLSSEQLPLGKDQDQHGPGKARRLGHGTTAMLLPPFIAVPR